MGHLEDRYKMNCELMYLIYYKVSFLKHLIFLGVPVDIQILGSPK